MAINKTALAQSIAVLLGTATCSFAVFGQEQPPPSEGQAPGAPEQVIDEVIAVGRLKSTAFDVVGERLEQEVVTDFLGAEAIARVGDSTVSLALRRVPGLTLVNDQFIYVRGLGERYSSVLLNGAQVPSPDLTRNVIPLDIFPTEIIQALAVQKGYSPEQPAAFGGGNVDIRTRGIPNGPVFNVEIGSGMNGDSDDDGLTYPGGGQDSLGEDDGTRGYPDALIAGLQHYAGNITPINILSTLRNDDGNFHFVSAAEAKNRELAVALNRDVELGTKSLGPDGSLEIDLGNRWFLGGDDQWQLGVLGLVSYDNGWRNRERIERDVADPINQVENKFRTINQVSATGVLNLGLALGSDHELATSNFFLRNTEDESAIATRTTNNFQLANGQRLRDYDIRFEQRELKVSQIRGHHVNGADTKELSPFFERRAVDGMVLDWYVSDSTALTDIPNEIKFSAEDSVDPATGEQLQTAIRQSNSAADYRYTFLRDQVDSSGWDLMKPFTFEHVDVEISGGQDVSQKGRSYTQTQFGLGTTAAAALPILVGTPGQVFTDEHILNPANGFILSAGGIGTESYLAGQTTSARYFKADALVNEKWRYAGGFRYESFRQVSLPIDPLEYSTNGQCALSPCDAAALERISFAEDELYPAISVTRIMHDVWAQDFQLRFGLSETVARPDLREVTGSTYIDPLTETRVRGNPALLTSAITNLDLRAEWFFENGDNFTASLFYKEIQNPIETVQGAGTDDNISLTFVNAETADVTGLEIEWLKDLSSFGPRFFEPFFFSGNVTVGDSEITVGDVGFNVTNDVRPMAQHSEYVANLQLGYDANNGEHSFTLAYNTFGERLFFAGRDGVPDAYEQPFNSLDFVYSYYPTERVSVKFRIQNLLDEKLEIEQGGILVIEQNVGATAKVDVKWNLK
jgi:outer membrane receptor protein involved in Fe transport